MSPDCLNCAAPVTQNYCANCGQKSTTHRFVQGKRVPYFSFVTLILLMLTVSGLIAPYTHGKMSDLMPQ